MRRALAAALCASLATAAFASPDDAPPRVELPDGPVVRANGPLTVRVAGGADRVRAPGTPWALPVGDRGDEFVLQMPAAVSVPLGLTVERRGSTDHVTVAATIAPSDGSESDASARPFDPLLLGPDPDLFAATEEAAAASPYLDLRTSTIVLLTAGTLVVLAIVLAFRRDRPWVRAAWLAAPALAASAVLAAGAPTAALVAVPLAVDGDLKVVYVRIRAVRDGSGTLTPPSTARSSDPATAVIRYSTDDRSVEEVEAGREVRFTLRAGESRVVGYGCQHEKMLWLVPSSAPARIAAGPAVTRWLSSYRLAPRITLAAVDPKSRPVSSDIRVLPGVEVHVDVLPVK
jgi:hypothetical protein